MSPIASPTGRVLVVDDDRDIADFLFQLLTGAGNQVTVARDGPGALKAVAIAPPDLVLLDIGLPGLSDLEVCRQLKADFATRLIPILILTGSDPGEGRISAWEAGADEYLTKPARAIEVMARCRSLFRLKFAMDELDSSNATVLAFVRAVEAKCPLTQGHTERTTDYAIRLATRLDIPATEREIIRQGGMLHDIGKISTPDALLNKPGRLTSEEYSVVKKHPLDGVRIVEPLRSLRACLPLIRWHHERRDGSRYPDGLTGGTIPLAARLLAVADVFDAFASPYRPALSYAESLEVMREDARKGGLDSELVEIFAALLSEQSKETLTTQGP